MPEHGRTLSDEESRLSRRLVDRLRVVVSEEIDQWPELDASTCFEMVAASLGAIMAATVGMLEERVGQGPTNAQMVAAYVFHFERLLSADTH